jgi:hypothetical protein
MSAQGKVEVRVFCDGGFHQALEITLPFPTTKAAVNQRIRSAGRTVKGDGRTFCREHRP